MTIQWPEELPYDQGNVTFGTWDACVQRDRTTLAIHTSLLLEDMYPASYLWGLLCGYFEELDLWFGGYSQQHINALSDSHVLREKAV